MMAYKRLPIVFLVMAMTTFLPGILSAQDLEQGVKDIAQQLSASMSGQVKKLAVIEFPDLNGYQSSLGQFIAEELITQLSAGGKPGQFDVVERRQLARVLKEQQLTESGLFDADSIAKIGKMLGIEAIITGSIADLGADVKINARAISVETAKVFSAASAKIPKSETVQLLMRQSAGQGGASPVVGGSQAPGRRVQRGDVFFQNEFLRVDVASAAVAKTKNTVSFSLTFQNLASKEIFVAVDRNYYHCLAGVTDNLGAIAPSHTFEKVFLTGLPCLRGRQEKVEPQAYAKLGPGSRTSVVIAFESKDELFEGNVFTVTMSLLVLDGEDYSRLSMGISDIEIAN